MAGRRNRKSTKNKSFNVVKDGVSTKRIKAPGISERNLQKDVEISEGEQVRAQDNGSSREEK